MHVKMGNKIKELGKLDGCKQEDLANALGVTCQAVSRWDANGGYPDMEMIPSIANYFGVSIDVLRGSPLPDATIYLFYSRRRDYYKRLKFKRGGSLARDIATPCGSH